MNQLLSKYNKMNTAVKAGLWFTVCNFLQRGIQFLVTPLYTRLLSTEGYGVYSVFLTWINLISMFATLSLANGVFNNGMIKYNDDQDGYTSSMQGLSFCSCIIVFVLYTIIYPIIKPVIGISYPLSILMFVVIYFQMSIQLWSSRQRYSFKYRMLIIITIALSLLTPIIGLALFQTVDSTGTSLIWGYSIANIFIGVFLWTSNTVKGKKFFDFKYWKFAFEFNILLIPHYLSNIILGQSDRVMINLFCGPSQAGIYTLAYQVSLMMNIVTSGIVNSLSPWTYKKLEAHKYKDISIAATKLLLFLSLASVVVLLLAPEIILILGTNNYKDATWIIPPVVLSVVITFAYGLFVNVLFYFEETKYVMLGTTMGALINVVLNAILIPKFGYIAAGYTTAIGYAVIFITNLYYMKKTCKKNKIKTDIYNIKSILFLLIGLTLICVIILFIYQYRVIRYTFLAVLFVTIFIMRKKMIYIITEMRKKN